MRLQHRQPLLTRSSISLTTNPNVTITASSLLRTGLTRLLYLLASSKSSMRVRLLRVAFAASRPTKNNIQLNHGDGLATFLEAAI